jgi:5-methylcytosine-specific restriction endonuclease McrA
MITNRKVLVLNANFEPINICNVKRAFGLMFSEKAVLVINGRGTLFTVDNNFQIPSVIRLQYMVHRPKSNVCLSRKEILRRDHYTCQYCGKSADNLTIDHVYPRHLGGKLTWENLVTSCSICNNQKGGRTLKEAHMKLLKLPKSPPQSAMYFYGKHLNENKEWTDFLVGW